MKALCKICKKVVIPKKGRWKCCGFDEPVRKPRPFKDLNRWLDSTVGDANGLFDEEDFEEDWYDWNGV